MLTKLLASRSRHALAALFAALVAAAAVGVGTADASQYLHTYKTSIDVKLKITETSNWNGIRPGCFAPQESFGMTYGLDLDSTPKKSSKLLRGVATLTKKSFGTTPTFGAKESFTQTGKPGQWTLQSEFPAGCSGKALPPPSWVVNPVCKPVAERLFATLLQTEITDPDDQDGSLNDGTLLLMRTPKAKPAAFGSSIGDGCYRTLQDVYPVGVQSLLAIGPKSTVIEIPVPKLKNKLIRIATGSDKANPSFRISINVAGDCNAMHMTPYTGPHPDFSPRSFTEPHGALGDGVDNPANSSCTLKGKGYAEVTRESAVVSTDIPGR
jgi:hypothetical protein